MAKIRPVATAHDQAGGADTSPLESTPPGPDPATPALTTSTSDTPAPANPASDTSANPASTNPAPATSAEASSRRLISSSALMAAGTAVSRLLGFGRLMLLVLLFGNGTRQAEMFTVANTVPNSMYILLAGGVLNTVLVPQIVRAIRADPDRGEAYTNRILTAGLMALAAITVTLTVAVPAVIALYSAPGWKSPAVSAQYASMIMLAYYCMPQIFFYGVHVLAGQVLNARDRFGPMMWAPIANNVISIGVLLGFWLVLGRTNPSQPFTASQELLLGLGSTLGIAGQAAVLVPFLRAAGYRYRPRFDFRHTGLGHTASLAKWTLGFVLITQAALVAVNRLATSATVGGSGAGLAAYSYAYAMWILPHSLITVSLATAMLPSASRLAYAGDLAGVREELLRTMRLALAVVLPAAVAFFAVGVPLARLAFGFGRGARDADFTGWALMALSLGLVPFTLQYLCLRAYYALEDTRSPFLLQLVISGTHVVLAVTAVRLVGRPSLVAAGLGAAYAVAYLLGVTVSFSRLRRRLPGLSARQLVRLAVRLLVAATPAAAAAFGVCYGFERWSDSQPARLLGLAVAGLVGVALFALGARLLSIDEVGQIVTTLLRRRSRTAAQSTQRDATNVAVLRSGPAPPSIDPNVDPAAAAESGPGEPARPEENADPMLTQAGPLRPGQTRSGQATRPDPASGPLPGPSPDPALSAGTVLGKRYRMEELLAESQPAVTWRAFDMVLSRSVLVHLLAPGDAAAPRLLAAARHASAATDSRFLRVLDAVAGEPAGESGAGADGGSSAGVGVGSYIVCEYAVGQSLEVILSSGPLSGLEAAWVVREVADALAGVSTLGLHHERISPTTVVITPTGHVKIVGLLIEAALRPRAERWTNADGRRGVDSGVPESAEAPEQADVTDLGRLLYATLVARWPGGPAFGLPEAPRINHHWMSPRQVRAGVSPTLDAVCDQILGDPPRHRAARLTNAAGVASALTKILGHADAAGDLERRLRQPIPAVRPTSHDVTPASPLLEPGESATDTGGTTPVRGAPPVSARAVADPGGPTAHFGPAAGQAGYTRAVPAPALPTTTARTPLPGPTAAASPAAATGLGASAGSVGGATARTAGTASAARGAGVSRRRLGLVALLIALLLAAGALGVAALTRGRDGAAPPAASAQPSGSTATDPASDPPPSPTDPAGLLPIRDAQDFDPQGDDGTENPDEVSRAYDGDPKTRWRTLAYRGNPKLGGIKRGVGLVLDLGTAQSVRTLTVRLSGTGTDLEARIPKTDPEQVTAAPMSSDKRWRVVADQTDVGRTATLDLGGVTTRFVLVYLTSLPQEGANYRGGIYEVQVQG